MVEWAISVLFQKALEQYIFVIGGNVERDKTRRLTEEREAIIKLIISWPEVLHSPLDVSSGERGEGVITAILDNCDDVVLCIAMGQDKKGRNAPGSPLGKER